VRTASVSWSRGACAYGRYEVRPIVGVELMLARVADDADHGGARLAGRTCKVEGAFQKSGIVVASCRGLKAWDVTA
jgi:hypothetical protein